MTAWQTIQSLSTAVENDLGFSEISVKQVYQSTTMSRNEQVSILTFSYTLHYHQVNYIIFLLENNFPNGTTNQTFKVSFKFSWDLFLT